MLGVYLISGTPLFLLVLSGTETGRVAWHIFPDTAFSSAGHKVDPLNLASEPTLEHGRKLQRLPGSALAIFRAAKN